MIKKDTLVKQTHILHSQKRDSVCILPVGVVVAAREREREPNDFEWARINRASSLLVASSARRRLEGTSSFPSPFRPFPGFQIWLWPILLNKKNRSIRTCLKRKMSMRNGYSPQETSNVSRGIGNWASRKPRDSRCKKNNAFRQLCTMYPSPCSAI